MDWALARVVERSGDVTSRGSQWPWRDSMAETRWGVRRGLRDVAITRCPAERACLARERPRPEEQPVMSQTGGWGGILE
jgi:hypothetical protein